MATKYYVASSDGLTSLKSAIGDVQRQVQTYLDKKLIISIADVEYKTIGKIDVPIKQVTTSIFKNKILQEYTLDTSQEIEINKELPEKSGGI